MLKIDSEIIKTAKLIDKNIEINGATHPELALSNILSHLRNLVEAVILKVAADGEEIDPMNYAIRRALIETTKKRGDYHFLTDFYDMLESSVSHYTRDSDEAERLLLKYYEHLETIRQFLTNKYDICILTQLDKLTLTDSTGFLDYYEELSHLLTKPIPLPTRQQIEITGYIQKCTHFRVAENTFYEVVFTDNPLNDKSSHFLAYSEFAIHSSYRVALAIHKDTANIFGINLPILVIDDWKISIEPDAWDMLAKILGCQIHCDSESREYINLMQLLKEKQTSLSKLIAEIDSEAYRLLKQKVIKSSSNTPLFNLIDQCRTIIYEGHDGANILRYLLYKMSYKILESQFEYTPCEKLSNLYLKYACIPFEKMPYCTALSRHNPKLLDLIECIPQFDREHELLARRVKINTETRHLLFTPISELQETFENIDELIERHNAMLYDLHTSRKLKKFRNSAVYINDYVTTTLKVIEELRNSKGTGDPSWTSRACQTVLDLALNIDDEIKRATLTNLFKKSNLAVIYGSAGSGKTTLIAYLSQIISEKKILVLAITHAALRNLRQKINVSNCTFMTVSAFLNSPNQGQYEVTIIDECTLVSNGTMNRLLKVLSSNYLMLVGDSFQIESIRFGNWFRLAKEFLDTESIFDLDKGPQAQTRQYRTQQPELIKLWDSVRKSDYKVLLEHLLNYNLSSRVNSDLFLLNPTDTVVLSLNYDGPFGINSINQFMQGTNPNPPYQLGLLTFKETDPILFNRPDLLDPIIHNNSRGKILNIEEDDDYFVFTIELEYRICTSEVPYSPIELLDEINEGRSIIKFPISKSKLSSEGAQYVIPFQLAYAISIHKAQGLEFNSVKLVVTARTIRQYTPNIFYTAITRARKSVRIFWNPMVENLMLKHLSSCPKNDRDKRILEQILRDPTLLT